MATLVFSLAGQHLGASLLSGTAFSSIGGPVGFVVGRLIGGLLFPPDDPPPIEQFGPRLGERRVTTSAFGVPIPEVWGRMRVAGNVIWSSEIRETEHVDVQVHDVGGKGGKGAQQTVTTTTYTYDIDIAVAMGEGPINSLRTIRANGKVVYNDLASQNVGSRIKSSSLAEGIAIYLGTETQDVDPTIESAMGAANTPAYRGTAYVVFTGLQLEEFNNTVPNFEFEVYAEAGTQSLSIVEGSFFNKDYKIVGEAESWSDDPFVLGKISEDGTMFMYQIKNWIEDGVVGQPAKMWRGLLVRRIRVVNGVEGIPELIQLDWTTLGYPSPISAYSNAIGKRNQDEDDFVDP